MIITYYPKLSPVGSITTLKQPKVQPLFRFYDDVGHYLGSVRAYDRLAAAQTADRIYSGWASITEANSQDQL